jgi:hypothetical protein
MDTKHLEMLGDAVSRERNSQLGNAELGKIVLNYVQILERECERDAREQVNKGQA